MAGTIKGRIGLILKNKRFGSSSNGTASFDASDFPTIADKAELVFRNGHYHFQQ
jgi:hypothetical protein